MASDQVNPDVCPAPSRLTKWHPDSAPIALFRSGAVNPILANRGRSLSETVLISERLFRVLCMGSNFQVSLVAEP
ncbi:hypothetical protein OUZ56_028898 [Daphnia magna]|uniref:Uncharacterized protein n=1 Tax=Daphnia magna TaxID=35525 RepID=A0ABR0B587_9CRUS|nr:hypothetical protein OUZ56_028898 [Daphnia magna]